VSLGQENEADWNPPVDIKLHDSHFTQAAHTAHHHISRKCARQKRLNLCKKLATVNDGKLLYIDG